MESTFTTIGAFVSFVVCCFVVAMAVQTVFNNMEIKKVREDYNNLIKALEIACENNKEDNIESE